MTNVRWRRAREVFEQAMEMDESRQTDFVRQACGDDQFLLAEVKKMIAADRQNNSLLDQPIFHWGVMTQTTHEEPSGDLPFNYIGNYRLIEKLGEGGMGEVYLAVEEPLGRKVAIKLMRAGLEAAYLQRFNDERKALASLNQRNIVTLFTSGEAYKRHYFVMEYLEGESLRERIHRGPVPPAEVAAITRQICDALNAAHSRGIVHRDIKPENIFLARDDDGLLVKILDFGVATLKESDTRTATSAVVGTWAYLSPEQARGLNRKEIDGRADIYSLGVVVYEMLTGLRPFTATDSSGYRHLHLNVMPQPPSEREGGAGVTTAINGVVMKALAKDPKDRYNNAREFAQKLKEAVEARRGPPTLIETQPPMPRKNTALARNVLLCAMILALMGAGGWWAFNHFKPNTTIAGNSPSGGQSNSTGEQPGRQTGDSGASGAGNQANSSGTTSAPSVTPPAAVLRPELKVELEQEGKGSVLANSVFHSGDAVRLVTSPNRGGYVYIVMKGTSGPAEVLYPDPKIKGSYDAVQADQRVETPPSKSQMPWFRLKGRPGVETLYVVFVEQKGDERLQALESAIQQKRPQLNKAEERQTLAALDDLAARQTASPTLTAKKILLRHEK